MRDRFTLFRSTFDAMMVFPAEDVKKILGMMGRYAMDDVLPEPEESAAYGMFLSIKPLIDTSIKRSEAGKKESKHDQTASNQHQNTSNTNQTASNCGNTATKIKEESRKVKEESQKIKQFKPPTREELQLYLSESMGKYQVDVDRFLDYYNSNGWMVGKNHMKDWKAAVRNWSRSQRPEKTAKTPINLPSTQRTYDFDALELALFEAAQQ